MRNTRRVPFVLNLDDPEDVAIWEALQPMLNRHRASQFIRRAVAHELSVGTVPLSASEQRPELASGLISHAKRPTSQATEEEPTNRDNGHGEGTLDEATGNFLGMFG